MKRLLLTTLLAGVMAVPGQAAETAAEAAASASSSWSPGIMCTEPCP